MRRMASLQTDQSRTQINWLTALVMLAFHALAAVALFHFTWRGLWVAVALWWISTSLGIGIGYHRLLTHRGFRCPKWLEYSLAVCGTLALEGGPIFWVGVHRIHHQLTDKPGDPHSPRDGKWWSHMGWVLLGQSLHDETEKLAPYVPDLRRDRFYLWLSHYHWMTQVVVGLAVYFAFGWQVTLWAVFLRTVVGLHCTWLVNSATHIWGSRRWATGDDSTNSLLIALFTWGEGWHNNHHAHPNSARHGLRWWEVDTNWYVIRLMSALGLVRDIKLPRADSRVREIRKGADARAEETTVAPGLTIAGD